MSRYGVGILLELVAMSAVIGPTERAHADNWEQRLRTEILKASSSYLEILEGYQYESESTFRSSSDELIARRRISGLQSSGRGLMAMKPLIPPTGESEVWAINELYSFQIVEKAGRGWALTGFSDFATGELPVEPFRRMGGSKAILQGVSPYFVELNWLPNWLNDSRLVIRDVKPSPQSPESLVTFGFEWRDDVKSIDGSFSLDPRRMWVIAEFSLNQRSAGGTKSIRRVNEFADGEFPLMRSAKITRMGQPISSTKASTTDETVVFTFSRRKADPGEFMLSAFGLPEPIRESARTRWHVWLAFMGLIALALGIWIKRTARVRANIAQ